LNFHNHDSHENYKRINIHDDYIICSEKSSYDPKEILLENPNNNYIENQLEKINLNDRKNEIKKGINKLNNIDDKEFVNIDKEKSNKGSQRENNFQENLLDTSLELEEGIEKKD